MAHPKEHHYQVQTQWTGNLGQGTQNYRAYERAHEITSTGKAPIEGSSDPTFRGDATRYNPEELMVAALSSCHMLWYLHLCSTAKVVVTSYVDNATGTMSETADGGGHFTSVVLQPQITIKPDGDLTVAEQLHKQAHKLCFIANSVNFPVSCEPQITVKTDD